MDTDLYLVIGIIIAGFSLPSIFGAIAEGRAPRAAAIMVMIGGGLIALAVTQKPSGYTLDEVPQAFVNVIGRYIN